MKWLERYIQDAWLSVHFAVNVLIATSLLWLMSKLWPVPDTEDSQTPHKHS